MAFDVVVTSPLQENFVCALASFDEEERERALLNAEGYKYDKSEGYDFAPLAFDTFGGCSSDTAKILKVLITGVEDRFGAVRAEVACHLRQRMSLGIQRFNANMILSRMPPSAVLGSAVS